MKKVLYILLISLFSFNLFANTLEELAEKHLEKSLESTKYEHSIFIVVCSKRYNRCSTMELSLENILVNNNINLMDHVKEDAKFVVLSNPMYVARDLSGSISLSFSYDIFIFLEMEENKFGESFIQIPKADFSGSINQSFVLGALKKEYHLYEDSEKFSTLTYINYGNKNEK